MNVKNLHISFRLELDKINSGLYDDLIDEEVDYYLNKAQTEFIKQRYNPPSNQYQTGFEMNEKRTVDLKNLHVTNYQDTVYLTNEINKYRFQLPSNFMYFTSGQATVYNSYCNQITYTTVTTEKIYFQIPVQFNNLTNQNFNNFRIAINTTSNLLFTPLTGYQYPEDEENYLTAIQNLQLPTGYRIMYEGFYTIYEQSNLFVEVPTATNLFITYDGGTNWQSVTSSQLTLQNRVGATLGTRKVSPVRRCAIDDLYILLKDSFATTTPDYPLTIEQTNFIDSYGNNSFIIENFIASYIRIPKSISLSLNQTSELAPQVHQELIAMAVNMALEAIESKRYETNQLELKRAE